MKQMKLLGPKTSVEEESLPLVKHVSIVVKFQAKIRLVLIV